MTAQDFSVSGQQVLVVGAARSGVAAAQLLARRGARVTLTDRKPQIPEAGRSCGRPAWRSSSAATTPRPSRPRT